MWYRRCRKGADARQRGVRRMETRAFDGASLRGSNELWVGERVRRCCRVDRVFKEPKKSHKSGVQSDRLYRVPLVPVLYFIARLGLWLTRRLCPMWQRKGGKERARTQTQEHTSLCRFYMI